MQGYCQSAALAIWSKDSSSGNFLVCLGSYGPTIMTGCSQTVTYTCWCEGAMDNLQGITTAIVVMLFDLSGFNYPQLASIQVLELTNPAETCVLIKPGHG